MTVEASNDGGIASWDFLEPPRIRVDAAKAEIIGNWSSEDIRAFQEAEERARRREVIGGTIHALALHLGPDSFVERHLITLDLDA